MRITVSVRPNKGSVFLPCSRGKRTESLPEMLCCFVNRKPRTDKFKVILFCVTQTLKTEVKMSHVPFLHSLLSFLSSKYMSRPYVYWTVHHLDSWIKTDQLDVTCFIISVFTAQHVSNVSTSIFRSLRLICGFISWVVLLWFDVCWCYGVVRLGWCGILMQLKYFSPWNKPTNKSQAPEDGCTNIRNMLSSK